MGLMSMRRAMTGAAARRRPDSAISSLKPMSRPLAFRLVMMAIAGEVLALHLTYVHYRLHRDPEWQSVCAISDHVNCDTVILSPYGSIAGIPLPIIGAWFYLVVGSIAAADGWNRRRLFVRSRALVIFGLCLIATVASAALGGISILSLRSLCLLCAGVYAVNVGLLILSLFALRSTGESIEAAFAGELAHARSQAFRSAVAVAFVIVALLVMRGAYLRGTAGGSVVCEAVAAALRGRVAAPVELKVYSDFQCPYCKALHRDLRAVKAGAGLRTLLIHYPIDRTCNLSAKYTRHPGACLQARAALCADALGYGDQFTGLLFEEGVSTRDGLLRLARPLGIDPLDFDRCLESTDTNERLQKSIRDASSDSVRATPTVFVNGRRQVGRLNEDDFHCLRLANQRPELDSKRGER